VIVGESVEVAVAVRVGVEVMVAVAVAVKVFEGVPVAVEVPVLTGVLVMVGVSVGELFPGLVGLFGLEQALTIRPTVTKRRAKNRNDLNFMGRLL